MLQNEIAPAWVNLDMSDRIRMARKFAGVSQQQLATRLGIKRAAVTQWEAAAGTYPATANLAQTALETGVSFEWLATGRGNMRLEAPEGPAFSVDCVAQSFEEEHLLSAFRRCNSKQRGALLEFLKATGSERRAAR